MRARFNLLPRGWRLAALITVALFLAAAPARSQSAQEFTIKATFIAKFVAFVKWPEHAGPGIDPGKPFTFAVFGPNPFHEDLEASLRKALPPGKAVRIRAVNQVAALAGSDLVFIGGEEKARLAEVVEWAKSNGALTVGDGDGFADRGVIINFYPSGSKVRFEINPAAAERAGFQISSLLLKVARIVEDE